jgi:c-di-GMP-binding flagellar brake protein YcgR
MDERRNFIRFQCPTDMIINLLEPSDTAVEAFIEDVSRGGLSLVTNKKFKDRETVTIGIRLPTQKSIIQARARVVWSMRAGTAKNRFKSGLKFSEIKPADRQEILDYVYEEWKKNFSQVKI